jgi:hypothetical protein
MAGPWPYREIYLSREDSAGGVVIEVQRPVQLDQRLATLQALTAGIDELSV